MPIFSKTPKGKTALSDESSWEDWKAWQEEYRRTPTMSQDTSRRGILRNSVDPSPRGTPAARTSDPAASSPAFDTAQEGRSRFNSMPTSAKEKNVSGSTARFPVHHSPSLSQLSDRARDLAPPRTSDAEADRLARACGDGPFSPTSPSPFFETSAFVGTAGARSRSQSASTPRGRRSSAAQIRPAPRLQPFPHPTKPHAVRALTRILNEDTKTFKLHDYIEVEDLMSGRLWEDEDELPVDCVRDKAEDDSGHDGVWRRERRERRLMSGVNRAIRQRDGSVFGSYIQDLPETAMTAVIVGGYKHCVPGVVAACVDELYKTGVFVDDLFRALPNRNRLFNLVALFDQPDLSSRLSSRASLPNINSSPSLRPTASMRNPAALLQQESCPEICALLVTYLTSLPTPLIHRCLVEALWSWCVSPSVLRHEQRLRRRGDDDASESSSSDSDQDEEAPSYSTRLRQREEVLLNLPSFAVQLQIARQVLLLLPPRQFSLVAYLLSFFAMLQVCPDNTLSPEDIGRIFGGAFVGGRSRSDSAAPVGADASGRRQSKVSVGPSDTAERTMRDKEERSLRIMSWLIKHWPQISEAYESDDDGPRGQRGYSPRMGAMATEAVPPRRQWQSEGSALHPTTRETGGGVSARRRTLGGESEWNGRMPSQPRAQANKPTQFTEIGASSLERQNRPRADSRRQEIQRTAPRRPVDEDYMASPIPRLEIPQGLGEDRLFETPAPFDLNTANEASDDASMYSTDTGDFYDMYASSLLREPLPNPHDLPDVSLDAPPPTPATPQRANKNKIADPDIRVDLMAASKFVLERENAELRRQLDEALGERDQARTVLEAMRGVVGNAR